MGSDEFLHQDIGVSGLPESPVHELAVTQHGGYIMPTYKTIDIVTTGVRNYMTIFFSALSSTFLLARSWGVVDALPPNKLPALVSDLPQYLLVLLVLTVLGFLVLEFMKHFHANLSPARSILTRMGSGAALLLIFVVITLAFISSIYVAFMTGFVSAG